MKKFFLIIGILAGILSCKTIYVPVETDTQVHVIDSVAIRYLDSIRIYEATRYREMGWLNDTARIKSSRGNIAWAVADTAGERLTLGLEEAPFEEKTKYVYKDKIVYKDSLVYKEKPVPVEIVKEVKVVPKFWRVFGIIGIVLSCVLITIGIIKIKSGKFLKLFKK